jgi:hypothetical protein
VGTDTGREIPAAYLWKPCRKRVERAESNVTSLRAGSQELGQIKNQRYSQPKVTKRCYSADRANGCLRPRSLVGRGSFFQAVHDFNGPLNLPVYARPGHICRK